MYTKHSKSYQRPFIQFLYPAEFEQDARHDHVTIVILS